MDACKRRIIMQGFNKCPHCGKDTVPAHPPESRATAAMCQNPDCKKVVERDTGLMIPKKATP